MQIDKLVSQIMNDILSGLRGYHHNLSINQEQIADEVIQTRLFIIKQQIASGTLLVKDMLTAINCVEVDCESLERCRCNNDGCDTLTAHFEIPQLLNDFGSAAIDYIGSADRQQNFTIVNSLSEFKLKKYKKRSKNKPYVWIDYAPNHNGMLDCFIFNAPFIKTVSVVGVFKDPRQMKKFACCTDDPDEAENDSLSFINQLIKEKIVADKIQYYRQTAAVPIANNQQYLTGN